MATLFRIEATARYRAPLLDRVPGLRLVVIVAACAIGVVVVTGWARAGLERHAAREALCAARFDTWKVRNPILAKGVFLRAFHCEQLRDVAPELVP